ncbi:sulfurtransferase [Jannaschia sp. EhC01]|nr:sulfurtransferase [Jannaschia sp. EhC01]
METEKTENGTLQHWTPAEVKAAFDKDEIILIDVRTPQEFNVERIEGALLAPMQAFQPRHMPSQSEKPIVFHCGSGARSAKVAQQCLESGEDRIAHMKGGFSAWKDAGFEYTGTDMASGAPKKMRKS